MRIRASAFTLIECVLALGIASMVLVAVMGLLPGALDAVRAAGQRQAEATILDNLRARSAGGLAPGDYFYNADGLPVSDHAAGATFAVRIEEAEATALPGDAEAALRCVRIKISTHITNDPFRDERHLRAQTLLFAPAQTGGGL